MSGKFWKTPVMKFAVMKFAIRPKLPAQEGFYISQLLGFGNLLICKIGLKNFQKQPTFVIWQTTPYHNQYNILSNRFGEKCSRRKCAEFLVCGNSICWNRVCGNNVCGNCIIGNCVCVNHVLETTFVETMFMVISVKGKIRKCLFFRVQSWKMTVCQEGFQTGC